MKITVTPQHNGLRLEGTYRGNYYHKLYIDYSAREAKHDFRQYVRDQDAKIIREKKAHVDRHL